MDDAKHMRIGVAQDEQGNLYHKHITDMSETTLAGQPDTERRRVFEAWRNTGYHPHLMPVGHAGLTERDLHLARALYTHLDPAVVQAHVDGKIDPLGLNT